MEIFLLDFMPWLLRMKRPGHKFSYHSFVSLIKEGFKTKKQPRASVMQHSENGTYSATENRLWSSFCEECATENAAKVCLVLLEK